MHISNKMIAKRTKLLIQNGNLETYPTEWKKMKNYLREQGKGLLLSEHHYGKMSGGTSAGCVWISLNDSGLEDRIDNLLWYYNDVRGDLISLLRGETIPRIHRVTSELFHMVEKWGIKTTPEGSYLTYDGSRDDLPNGDHLLPSREELGTWKDFDFPKL